MNTLIRAILLVVCFAIGTVPGHGKQQSGSSPSQVNPKSDELKLDGLHNVFRITEKLVSGSSPEEDAGFRSLQKLGIKTVITVDGAQPDLERAHKFGMRYVHIPIGYDGVPRDAALKVARAIRDLPGPVYIHCHHGQHRGPAAAAVAHLLLDPDCTVERAVAEMRRAGTDLKYAGLYASPAAIRKLASADLDAAPNDFPESVKPAAFPQVMVHVDELWDKVKLIQAVGWKTPPDHPDISPAHEATMLVEQFREAARLPGAVSRPDDFRKWLGDAQARAEQLEAILAANKTGDIDGQKADGVFRSFAATCSRCHARYRDITQKK